MPAHIGTDIREQRHIVATQCRQLPQQTGQHSQHCRIDQQISAPSLPIAGQNLRRIAPARVVIKRDAHLPQAARIRRKAAWANQQAIGGDIQRQRRGFMQLLNQIGKAAKDKRLAAAKRNLQHTGCAQVLQHLRGGIDRPCALALHIA